MKKGQITLFIIVGIVILVLVIVGVVMSGWLQTEKENRMLREGQTKQQLHPVEEHVQECIKETGIKGLQILGSKGGYIYSRDKTLELPDYKIAYYDKTDKLLTSFFTKELKKYVDENLNSCLNFSKFTDSKITTNKVNSLPIITQKDTGFVLKDYNMVVSKSGTNITIANPSAVIPIRLYAIATLGNILLSKECVKIDKNEFVEEKLYVNMDPQKERNIYSITDKEANYTFVFAVKC